MPLGKGLASLNLLALGVQEPSGATKSERPSTTGEGQESRPEGACRAMPGMCCRKQPLYPDLPPLDMDLWVSPCWSSPFLVLWLERAGFSCFVLQFLFMPVLIISGSASQVLHPSYKKKKMKSSEFTTVPFFKSRSPQAVCLFLLSWLHIELFPLYLVIFLGEKRKTEPNISFLKNKYSF